MPATAGTQKDWFTNWCRRMQDRVRALETAPLPPSGGSGTPATTVTGPDIPNTTPVVGTSTNYAREDHDHGLLANVLEIADFGSGSIGFSESASPDAQLNFINSGLFPNDPLASSIHNRWQCAGLPAPVAANGPACWGLTAQVTNVDTSSFVPTIQVVLIVTNMTGSQMIELLWSATYSGPSGTGNSLAINFSTSGPTVSQQTGSDLNWNYTSHEVETTAGGIFQSLATLTLS